MNLAIGGLLGAAAVAGLIGSPHCLAMCGGFAVAALGPASGAGGSQRAQLLAWHAGRLSSYAALGVLAGSFGRSLPGAGPWAGAVGLLFLGWFSSRLAGIGVAAVWSARMTAATAGPLHSFVRFGAGLLARHDLPGRYLFGALNGLLPCGLVWSALAMPVAAADPWLGVASMLLFGAGTLPALSAAAVGLHRLQRAGMPVRRLVGAGVFAAGLGSILLRTEVLGFATESSAEEAPACHRAEAPGAAAPQPPPRPQL